MRTPPAASRRAITVASAPAGGAVAIDLGAGAGRQSFNVEQVLDSERRASKRPQFRSARAGCVDRVRFGERARRATSVNAPSAPFRASMRSSVSLRDLARAHSARSDRRGDRLQPFRQEASSSCREDRRRLLLIVERDRKKLLRLLRRDPQMHNRLSARFRRQRQTKQRRHRVHHGLRIECIPSHAIASSDAKRWGARATVILCA